MYYSLFLLWRLHFKYSLDVYYFSNFSHFIFFILPAADFSIIQAGKTKFIYAIFVLSFVFIPILIFLISADPRLERLINLSPDTIIQEARFQEILDFFEQGLMRDSLVFGQGLGATIQSSTYHYFETSTMHVGIFNIWMKMGIIPFLIVTTLLFFRIPFIYINTWIGRQHLSENTSTANIAILPSFFPWIASLAISGGFSEVSFFAAGISYYLYEEVRSNGLLRLIKADVNRP